ncbi:MAG TPA: TetR/AcrR family transcriptional regulator [Pseudolabrys sp.]|nr:TetR/AcrR family transcriptional regulator [Pseudolabrys sp.]
MTTQIELERPLAADDESAKRRQIIDGARAVFLAQGFDAASMGEIARAAGVSKGTLYVYFKNKEELFEAIVDQECGVQAERVFALDPHDPDLETTLTKCGIAYVNFLCRPEKASALRIVMAIADRMSGIGRKFYEQGPAIGIAKLAAFLKALVDAGTLEISDCEVAAAQLLDSFQSTMFKPLIFNFGGPPAPERIEHVVGMAVRAFLAAYRRRA